MTKGARTDGSGWPWPLVVTSHLPSKHWGSVLSFPWKRTILLPAQMTKIGILSPKFCPPKDCSQGRAARGDASGWPWPPVAPAHLPLNHWGSVLSLPWKRTVLLLQAPMAEIGIWPPKFYPRIAPRQKLPRQIGLAGLGLLGATSHLPSKHWGSTLSLQWKRTILPVQVPKVKTGVPPPKFQISMGCSQTNLPGQTDVAGLGLCWLCLLCP